MLHSLSSSWPWLVTFVPWCPGHGCCGKEDVQSLWYQEASSPKQVGRQEMGTGPGALPPLQLSLQSQQARMWQDTFILWGGQGTPCLCLDSANANWPLPNPQCNGKLQSYVSSLLPTTLVYLCLLENLFWGTNGISGMFCSHFAGMRWSGHFQVQTQERWRLVMVLSHTSLHILGHTGGTLLYHGILPIRGSISSSKDAAAEIFLV